MIKVILQISILTQKYVYENLQNHLRRKRLIQKYKNNGILSFIQKHQNTSTSQFRNLIVHVALIMTSLQRYHDLLSFF